jgi:acyl carrier protein
MTDQEFIELLNAVAKKAKPFNNELVLIDGLDMNLNETGLDSLDLLICAMQLCEIYDVEEEKSKELFGSTPQELLNFLKEWGRRQPNDYAEAKGLLA